MNVTSWQDVASEVAHLVRVCVLVSPTDAASALVITAVTPVTLNNHVHNFDRGFDTADTHFVCFPNTHTYIGYKLLRISQTF